MFAIAEDGCKISFEHLPGDRPVLLVHGFAADSTLTWSATGWLRALAGGGVVTVDLRGHGRSDRPGSGYSPEVMARDLLAVLDTAGLATVDVVTYSMGGLVAWALARRAPDRVGKLVLGGIGDHAVAAEDLDRVAAMRHAGLPACADGMAGHRIEGPAPVPVLVVAGTADDIAPDAAALAVRLGAPFTALPGRTHFTALSSRAFKQAAQAFLQG